ncbi:Leucine Rich Repeat family protein [Trichomonas vaginalis G3]|uniref:Leucine Rich Repeat family protein n=1 Tax=Trichomonas vaginalis (strain ATCC PRA-98 / G3) TaxID=412133 RepID=A2EWQ7_TRIV3|nr:uncharacterized protein TVAGG3_0211410 [Trichomonas vaginalis G3]EAY02887.1 Leucine Rich Repeat family protein [Trichomonas vaginalis G3]KAI5551252.1 cAMP biosynthetic process [Trichomonas vaginalis G3]|eukprot:XP_001315110.1 hypothetical protein [Trichomonas vaginalis G3]
MGQDESLPAIPPDQVDLALQRKKLTHLPYFLPSDSTVQSIDCSKNKISQFPLSLQNILSINLSDNNLGAIFADKNDLIFDYPNLKTLILTENSIENLPSSLKNIKSLTDLYLDRNKLTEADLDFPNLETLNLLMNFFTEIPKLPESLTSLNLGFNNIRTLSLSLPNLRVLSLSGNEISKIDPSISFPNLVHLDLSFNKIYSIPPITSFAPKLEELLIAFNMLEEFPTHIPLEIRRIDVSHNVISKWEDPICHLVQLTSLDISFNLITEVPELPPNIEIFTPHNNEIRKVYPITAPKLKKVFFSSNKLAKVPDTIESSLDIFSLERNSIENIDCSKISTNIRKLSLTHGFIGEVPPELCTFKVLQFLDLSGNHIVKLPDEIGEILNLQTLLLNENPISSLPQLPNSLVTLACCKCQFHEIPDSVHHLHSLKCLDFSCNRIKSISNLPEVPYINISCNLISSLPTLPVSIVNIHASHNKLRKFILEKDYKLLQEIDISHNRLTQVVLRQLDMLKSLKLAFNPLKIEIDFSKFPMIDCIDVVQTECTFSATSAPPTKMRELVYHDPEWFSRLTSAQFKLFECQKAGYSEQCGIRPSMEDALIIRTDPSPAIYGVVDGHAGFRTSNLAAYLLPMYFAKHDNKSVSGMAEVIRKLNDQLRKLEVKDGATLVVTIVTPTEIGCAHVGDARALVVRKDGTIAQLTSDHKATDRTEFDIVKENRAYLSAGRLMGTLAVSRAIGDFAIDGVMRVPSMTAYTMKKNDFRLVLGCDGIFDVMTNEEVGRIAAEVRDMHLAADTIKNIAFARGSQDNLSVVVVDIEQEE